MVRLKFLTQEHAGKNVSGEPCAVPTTFDQRFRENPHPPDGLSERRRDGTRALHLQGGHGYLDGGDGVQAAGAGGAALGHHAWRGLASLVHHVTAVSHHGEDGLRKLLGHAPAGQGNYKPQGRGGMVKVKFKSKVIQISGMVSQTQIKPSSGLNWVWNNLRAKWIPGLGLI